MKIAHHWKRLLLALTLAIAPATARADDARTVLFIGNSFTQGANSAVLRYRPDSVTDLNGGGVGGVPALFRRFAEQAGQDWNVSHELRGGTTLAQHRAERLDEIARPWDVVVMQEYSVLDPDKPGNPTVTAESAPAIAAAVTGANPKVRVYMTATWSRADQVYKPAGHWYGQPIERMALDLRAALDAIDAASRDIDGILPVGEAWNRAMAEAIADPNPYDGVAFGQVDLWSYDQYHASAAGYYLEALVVFGRVTGIDPRTLGKDEMAAHEIGLDPRVAEALQRVAAEALGFSGASTAGPSPSPY